MDTTLRERLKLIADRIDPAHVRATERLQEAVWAYEPVERIPVIMHSVMPPDWQTYPYTEAYENPEKMLANELGLAFLGVTLRDDRMLNLRANYGPAILPSLFGAPVHVDNATTWVEGCHDSERIRRIVAAGQPDIDGGLAARTYATEALYRDILKDAGLSDFVHIFQADCQSPFDCAYLLWGEEIYLSMHDEPQLVHALLDLIARTIIAFVQRQKQILGEPQNSIYHWWYKVPAGMRVVDDVAITLSPAMYDEFCKPYNEQVYAAFGNGYMHYCGHRLQSQQLRVETKGLRGIEMGAEDAWRTPEYTVANICAQAAQQQVTICWVGPGLPAERPPVRTGLIYGWIERDVPWEQAPAALEKAQAFWRNS